MLKNIKDVDLSPPHPGEILREDMLPRLALAPAALAEQLGVSVESIGDVIAERRPMTSEIATRLAAKFGHSVRFWLGLQAQYDRWAQAAPIGTA